jgi:DNA-binding transcriptional MerR regulator
MDEPEAHINSPLQQRAERDPQFAEEMWRFRHPEEDGEKLTLEAILVECPLRYGITVGSLDTLSRFYAWLKLKRRFQEKRNAIEQIKAEMAKDPDMTPDQIESAGRVMFLTESVVEKNAKVFSAMVKIGQTDKSLDQRERQLDQRDTELVQREKQVAQAERKLAILEKKAAFYDAVKEKAKDAGSGGVTAEQMEDIERRLKMM